VSRYLYNARVVPIGKPATIRGYDGQPVTFTFDEFDFSMSRSNARDIPVYIKHDPTLEIGNLHSLTPNREWWVACFEIDPAHGIEFDIGQNVSVGLRWHPDYPDQRRMGELSIVRRGQVPGAQITHRIPAPAPRPAPTPPPKLTPTRAAPQPVVYRKPSVSSREQAEEAEMRRRLEWLEKHTGRYDLEAVLIGMQRELHGPSPDELLRQQRAA
jgi:hypothetical protein